MDSLAIVTGREAEYVVMDIVRWFDAVLRVWEVFIASFSSLK